MTRFVLDTIARLISAGEITPEEGVLLACSTDRLDRAAGELSLVPTDRHYGDDAGKERAMDLLAAGLTQRQVGALVGANQSTISRWMDEAEEQAA